MGKALVVNVGTASDPSSTFTAVTAGSGSSLTVENFATADTAELVELTRQGATAGAVRVRSPKLSDQQQGIRFACSAGLESFLLPRDYQQGLYPQDALTIEVTGGASEVDGAAWSVYYDNLPGISQRLHMPGDFSGNIAYVDTWEVDVTAAGTAGNFGTALLNSLYSVIPNNTDIAIFGYVTDTAVLAVALNGTETGNLYLGGPGDTNPIRTRDYFARLSTDLGKPCVPVLNTGNSSAIEVAVAQTATSGTVKVTLTLAILKQLVTP